MNDSIQELETISSEEEEEYLKLQKKAKKLTIVLCVVLLLDVFVGVIALTDKRECESCAVNRIEDINFDDSYYSSDDTSR